MQGIISLCILDDKTKIWYFKIEHSIFYRYGSRTESFDTILYNMSIVVRAVAILEVVGTIATVAIAGNTDQAYTEVVLY